MCHTVKTHLLQIETARQQNSKTTTKNLKKRKRKAKQRIFFFVFSVFFFFMMIITILKEINNEFTSAENKEWPCYVWFVSVVILPFLGPPTPTYFSRFPLLFPKGEGESEREGMSLYGNSFSISPSVCLPICLSIHLSIYL